MFELYIIEIVIFRLHCIFILCIILKVESENKMSVDSSVVKLLMEERQRLCSEVSRIDRMLAREGIDASHLIEPGESPKTTSSGRPRNSIKKIDALRKALEEAPKPVSQRDLVAAMRVLGYVFASVKPANTLSPFLYGVKRPSWIKKRPDGFILATRENEFPNIASEITKPYE